MSAEFGRLHHPIIILVLVFWVDWLDAFFFLQHPTYHPTHHPGIGRHPGIILVSGVSDVLYLYHPDVILDMVLLGSVEASKL